MLVASRTAAIFIRENTSLPATLSINTEAFLPEWRAVNGIDGYALARKIEDAKWNLFSLAGDIRASVVGRDGPGTLRRAVKRLLAKQREHTFNCLEVTSVFSKRFLGIPFMRVTGHSRHIQESIFLVPIKEFVLGAPTNGVEKTGEETSKQDRPLVSR